MHERASARLSWVAKFIAGECHACGRICRKDAQVAFIHLVARLADFGAKGDPIFRMDGFDGHYALKRCADFRYLTRFIPFDAEVGQIVRPQAISQSIAQVFSFCRGACYMVLRKSSQDSKNYAESLPHNEVRSNAEFSERQFAREAPS